MGCLPHICMDEIQMILLLVPGLAWPVRRFHAWYVQRNIKHAKACHAEELNAESENEDAATTWSK